MSHTRSERCPQRAVARRVGLVLCVVLVGAACNSEETPPDGESKDRATTAEAEDPTPAEERDGAAAQPGPDPGSDAGSLEEQTQVAEQPPRPDLGLPTVELTTSPDGAGARPELAWRPVDAAASYVVTLYDPDGGAYWAWSGVGTSVVVGGFDPRPAEGSGVAPRVQAGMTWDVTAHGADDELIAQSGVRPIGP